MENVQANTWKCPIRCCKLFHTFITDLCLLVQTPEMSSKTPKYMCKFTIAHIVSQTDMESIHTIVKLLVAIIFIGKAIGDLNSNPGQRC